MNALDRNRLKDMLDAARKAQQFAAGKTRETLDENEVLALALVRLIEVIGEAASRVSEETRTAITGVEWRPIIGMRNRLIHDYLNVDYDVVWRAVADEIPPLIATLETALSDETAN